MSTESDLQYFVRDALAAGRSRKEIAGTLSEAGWSSTQIHEALASYAGTLGGVAVPRPRASSTARDTFVYGILFASLFITAWALGAMLFVIIDILFQEELVTDSLFRALRWPLSVAIVSTPVFVLMNRLVGEETDRDPNRKISEVRRKLTYLTLFISALVLLGTTAGLIYDVLGGDPSITFILKSLVVGGISGLGFVHYLREMRDEGALPGSGG